MTQLLESVSQIGKERKVNSFAFLISVDSRPLKLLVLLSHELPSLFHVVLGRFPQIFLPKWQCEYIAYPLWQKNITKPSYDEWGKQFLAKHE